MTVLLTMVVPTVEKMFADFGAPQAATADEVRDRLMSHGAVNMMPYLIGAESSRSS